MRWTRHIQDYALVTLITMLIWLYAEGRNVQKYPSDSMVPVPLNVELANPLVVIDQSPMNVSLQFKGARAELDRLRRLLPAGLHVQLNATEPGEKDYAAMELVRQAKPVANASVNVARVEPATVRLRVDRLVDKSLGVRFTPSDVQLLADSLKINPSQVKMTLPFGGVEQLGDSVALDVEPMVDLKTLEPGVEHTVRARVVLPGGLAGRSHIKINPATVKLKFTIDKKEDTFTLATVPVWITLPPSEQDQFKVELKESNRVLKDVKITGPSDLIAKVRKGTIPIIAYVRLGSDDLVKKVDKKTTATVRFDAPSLLNIDNPTPTVEFTVKRRPKAKP